MPGMMISSENRKYQLRRLTKSILRTRGGASGVSTLAASTRSSWAAAPGCPSSSGSSSASSSSDSGTSVPSLPAFMSSGGSDTIHPQQTRAPEAAARHHDRQQVVRDDDRRDQAGDDADAERDREAFHGPGSEEPEDDAGEDRRDVRVPDRGPGSAHGGVDRSRDCSPRSHLFFEALEDQDVGVDRHADRQDEACDARERQRDGHELESGKYRARIEEQSKARQEARHAVVDDHEQDHDREPEEACGDAELHGLGAQ